MRHSRQVAHDAADGQRCPCGGTITWTQAGTPTRAPNWRTGECLYHFCSPESMRALSAAFDRMWAYTRDNLDVASADCFARKT